MCLLLFELRSPSFVQLCLARDQEVAAGCLRSGFFLLPQLLSAFCDKKVGDEDRRFFEPGDGKAGSRSLAAAEKLARPSSNIEEQGKEVKATMVRSLLFLALVASVVCSVNAAAQVGGSIRGSPSAADGPESSSAASSALASAASSLLKVWPHPAAQVLHHATTAVRRKLQDEPLQPAEGDALEIACSGSSLETDEGIAECTALCAPAQCCQTGIGSENCGFAACLTYGDCLALASLFGVEVPPAAEGMVNGGGENGDGEVTVAEGEMGMANADNTTDTDADGDGDGDEPTGDGSFNDPEEGSLMDKLNDMAEGLKETAKQAMTDPSSLSTGAKVGIAIGCFIIFMMLVCLIKCCCCRKKSA